MTIPVDAAVGFGNALVVTFFLSLGAARACSRRGITNLPRIAFLSGLALVVFTVPDKAQVSDAAIFWSERRLAIGIVVANFCAVTVIVVGAVVGSRAALDTFPRRRHTYPSGITFPLVDTSTVDTLSRAHFTRIRRGANHRRPGLAAAPKAGFSAIASIEIVAFRIILTVPACTGCGFTDLPANAGNIVENALAGDGITPVIGRT